MNTEKQITVPFLIEECRKYYALPNNGVGGSLHVVLDDANTEDEDIRQCIIEAAAQSDIEGLKLCQLLLKASKTQRKKLVKNYLKYRV